MLRSAAASLLKASAIAHSQAASTSASVARLPFTDRCRVEPLRTILVAPPRACKPRYLSSATSAHQDQTPRSAIRSSSSESSPNTPSTASPPSSTTGRDSATLTPAWQQFNETFRSELSGAASSPSPANPSSVVNKMTREQQLEAEWAARPILGPPPAKPHTGRTVEINETSRNVAVGYKILMANLGRNQIRRELKLGERYEKPNQRRVRLKSERHRRRFAEMIREKVKLVMEIKKRGG